MYSQNVFEFELIISFEEIISGQFLKQIRNACGLYIRSTGVDLVLFHIVVEKWSTRISTDSKNWQSGPRTTEIYEFV